jgi:hypothetical protein
MAIRNEKNGDIIISGFEQGIAEDPYSGIADIRNMNLISVPKEASVNFATAQISPPVVSGTVSSADAGTFFATFAGAVGLENMMTIIFSIQSGLGVTTGVTYWIKGLTASTFQVTSDWAQTTTVHLTNGTGTFAVVNVGTTSNNSHIKYFTYDPDDTSDVGGGAYFGVDGTGKLWTNWVTTGTSHYWTYVGRSGTADFTYGNGLVYYASHNTAGNGKRWIFVFNNLTIDFFDMTTATWTYGWNPATATTHQTGYLTGGIHEAIVAPDNKVYFCNGNFINRFYQVSPTVAFDTTSAATYVYDTTSVLPFTDVAQCLAPLGNTLLIGGRNNIIYPWDTFSQLPSYPILLPEYNIVKMVTVNTNTFILVGNRGRVYYTNGTGAQLYKKIPDHISGTIEPYFTWGGLTSNKNQLYFSALVTTNAGSAITTYGGLWGIDLDTKALRLTNKLSYGTYAGYATAIIPNFGATGVNPAGTGMFIGWFNGSVSPNGNGIDTTVSAPYTGGQASIDSDLIPIGTFLKPTSNGRVEFKLTVPLATNESVQMFYRQKFSDAFTVVGSAITTATQGFNGYSWAYTSVPFQNSQWLQIRIVLTSTASSPSYCRLKEMRVGQN